VELHLCFVDMGSAEHSCERDLVLGRDRFLIEFVREPVGAPLYSFGVGVCGREGLQAIHDGGDCAN
jgi:hypothetical protein